MVYIRKYAGPLQPGSRSAYVPGTRSSMRRNAAASKIQRVYRKTKASRLMVSRSRAALNKTIAKHINNMTENKFQGYSLECAQPVAKPAGNQPISYFFYNSGNTLTQPGNSIFNPMNLFEFPKGDDSGNRNGDYMFLKKAHLKLELQMLPISTTVPEQGFQSTTQFRLMIVKANRKYNRLGESPVAGQSLFLTSENDQFGFGLAGSPSTASTFANMSQPINKRKWLVYKDIRFTLSTPSQQFLDTSIPDIVQGINTANEKYPVKKYVSCDLPIFKKTHFDPDSTVPDSVDTQWLLIIAACPTNYCTADVAAPRNIRLNILGTTSASDN